MSSGKKTGMIIGVLVALAIIGFGAVRYIESSTVNMVRSWIEDYSKINKTEAGEISYSLFSNKLEIRNVKTRLESGNMVQDITINSIEIDNPNRSLDKIASDSASGHSMVDVADAVTLRGSAAVITNAAPNLSIKWTDATDRVDKIRIDAAALAALKAGKATPEELYLDLLYGMEYAEAVLSDIAITVDGGPQGLFRLTAPGARSVGYDKGSIKDISFKDIKFFRGEKELAALGLLRVAGLNFPSRDVMRQLLQTQEQNLTGEQTTQMLRSVFLGEKPYLGLFEMADLKWTPVPGSALSVGRFTYENPVTHPFSFGLKLDHLIFPVNLTPELAQMALLGYKKLDVSGTFDMTLPDKAENISSDLTLQIVDLGRADIKMRGVVPGGLSGMPESLEDMKVTLLELGYSDEGLVPRSAAANKRMTGMEPDAALQLFESAMRAELLQDPAADKALTEQILQKIMEFARKPGSLRAVIKPEQPLSFQELATLPDNSPAFTLTVEPGKQRLQEAAEDALKAMTPPKKGN